MQVTLLSKDVTNNIPEVGKLERGVGGGVIRNEQGTTNRFTPQLDSNEKREKNPKVIIVVSVPTKPRCA